MPEKLSVSCGLPVISLYPIQADTLSIIFGLPIHFCCRNTYGEYEASVGIDGEVLAGVLPEKQYKLVAAWLTLHEEELYEAWNNAVQMKQLPKIRPLS